MNEDFNPYNHFSEGMTTEADSAPQAPEAPQPEPQAPVRPARPVPPQGAVRPAQPVPPQGAVRPAQPVPPQGAVRPAQPVPPQGTARPLPPVPPQPVPPQYMPMPQPMPVQPQPAPKRDPRDTAKLFGVISFIIGCFVLPATAMIFFNFRSSVSEKFGFATTYSLVLSLPAVIFGVLSLLKKPEKRLFPMLGIAFAAVLLLCAFITYFFMVNGEPAATSTIY